MPDDGQARRAGRRLSRRVVWFVAAALVALLLEGILVVTALVSPATGSRIGRQVSRGVGAAVRVWEGSNGSPGIPGRVAGAARTMWRDFFVPLWAVPSRPKAPSAFARCVSCHPDYGSLRRFATTYMDHPRHAQLGLSCSACHTDVEHPDPAPPAEALCRRCHEEVDRAGACKLCHPPGSLPHFYSLGMPRGGPVICATCHRPASFPGASKPLVKLREMSGRDRSVCAPCHAADACERCHPSGHSPGWQAGHGATVRQGGQETCLSCHTGTWCADRCHATGTARPRRRPLPQAAGP